MKVINFSIPQTFSEVEIHLFSDEHIGDCCSDISRLKERIEAVKNRENAFCILNGDIIDFASRSSIGDIESRDLNIMEQLKRAVELFEPIKKKIIAITNGNHEARAYKKEGIDMAQMIAMQLGISERYSPASVYIFFRFSNKKAHLHNKILYRIFCNHGSGGGRKEGAKAIRLADMASICDADIYIHSHTHLPMIMKQAYFRSSDSNSSIEKVTRLFVNTASNLNYGGYGEVQEFKPNSCDTPTIYLKGDYKNAKAVL